jgi:hypothetical protein
MQIIETDRSIHQNCQARNQETDSNISIAQTNLLHPSHAHPYSPLHKPGKRSPLHNLHFPKPLQSPLRHYYIPLLQKPHRPLRLLENVIPIPELPNLSTPTRTTKRVIHNGPFVEFPNFCLFTGQTFHSHSRIRRGEDLRGCGAWES